MAVAFIVGLITSTASVAKADGAGYTGVYYNIPGPADQGYHPDMGTRITGVVTGLVQNSLPITSTGLIDPQTGFPYIKQFDWWDGKYFAFSRVDPNLEFGNGWFPVNTPPQPGDPFYFSVHWTAILTAPTTGDYNFQMASDDDSWLFIDGTLTLDLGGIHGMSNTAGIIHLTAGDHSLDIYYAERHVVDAGFSFKFIPPPTVTINPGPSSVIPEVPFGSMIASVSLFAALVVFIGFKRIRLKIVQQ